MYKTLLSIFAICLLIAGCSKEKNDQKPVNHLYSDETGWTVPLNQLTLSSNPPDRIASIDQPIFDPISNNELSDHERVFILRSGNHVKIYPKNLVEIHEIINDRMDDEYFSITFCPLTGSAIAWNRKLKTHIAAFGVSGHLYMDNLIPYDRNSDNFYSQMQLECIKGAQSGNLLQAITLIETTAGASMSSFPNAKILIDTTRHSCNSVCNGKGLGGHKQILQHEYFGIIKKSISHQDEALLFGENIFHDSISIYATIYHQQNIIVVGSNRPYFRAAFIIQNGHIFNPIQASLPVVFSDQIGNKYDLSGYIVEGPSQGERLNSPLSYSAYYFAWELFYDGKYEIFKE